jgi:glycosyltransferase involved in cell wall biosynthesis
MRILYFHQHFATPKDSAGTRSYEFGRALVAAGHQVTVICGQHSRADRELPFDAQSGGRRGTVDGIDVLALPLHYSNHQNLLERARVFLRYAALGARVALREPHDLVIATSTPLTAGIPAMVSGWLGRKRRFVFEVRDLWPELPRALGLSNPWVLLGMDVLEWLSYRSADGCVGLAPGIVEGIRRKAGPTKPVALIPNGCDLELFRPELRTQLKAPGILPGDFVAGFTGAHGVANGLDAVLDVAAVLERRGRKDIKLLMIGDGSEKARLVERARREGLHACVFLPLMPKHELSKICASLDVGLQVLANVPAFYYGTSPNKFFDYLASGIAVVTNYPGWIADLVTRYDAGMCVPPQDPSAFADALEALASDKGRCRALGRNARALAEAEFSRADLARRFVRFVTEGDVEEGCS